MIHIGDSIGNYRLVEKLACGGFGCVYRAEHRFLSGRIVAIKLMHPQYLNSPRDQENFLQEAHVLGMLKHPHILPVIDAGIHEGLPYLIAEYASNGSLRDLIVEYAPNLLPTEKVMAILTEIGDALQYAHEQNIIHRDLKPGNILFNAKGDALLADFGIAMVLDESGTREADASGTLIYMAPEQFDKKISKKSDQYALGCIAYELFTGHRPSKVFEEDPITPTKPNPLLPIHIEQAILKAMAQKRNDRHRDVSAFIKALQKTKEHWINEGKALYDAHHYNDALSAYDHVLELDPEDLAGYTGRGDALRMLSRHAEALTAFEQAIQIDMNYAPAYRGKGATLRALKRYEEAVVAHNQALQFDANYALAYNGKGFALLDLERYEEAQAAFEQALGLDSNNMFAFYGKGIVRLILRRYEEALAVFDQVIQINPEYVGAYIRKGYAFYNLKRYEEALAAFEQAILFDTKNAQTYKDKGDALKMLSRYEEALMAYDQAIQLKSKYTDAYIGKIYALCNLQRYEEALVVSEQAVQSDPNSAFAYYPKGLAFFNFAERGKSSATQKFSVSGSLNPSSRGDSASVLNREIHELMSLLGLSQEEAAFKEKCYKEALSAFDRAIQIRPDFALAHYYKGKTLIELKHDEKALAALDQAILLDSTNADAYDRKGSALRHLSSDEEALKACENAIQLDSSRAHFHHNKGVTLERLGRWEEAQQSFATAERIEKEMT